MSVLSMMAFPQDVWGSNCGIPTEQPIEGWGLDPHRLSLEGTDIPGVLSPCVQKHLHPQSWLWCWEQAAWMPVLSNMEGGGGLLQARAGPSVRACEPEDAHCLACRWPRKHPLAPLSSFFLLAAVLCNSRYRRVGNQSPDSKAWTVWWVCLQAGVTLMGQWHLRRGRGVIAWPGEEAEGGADNSWGELNPKAAAGAKVKPQSSGGQTLGTGGLGWGCFSRAGPWRMLIRGLSQSEREDHLV